MSLEQACLLADRDSPFYLAPAFGSAATFQQNEPQVRAAFKTGAGIPWGEQTQCLSCAVARFFRPSYQNNLVQSWLPALGGMVEKLEQGARVADVGCGHGITTAIKELPGHYDLVTIFDCLHDMGDPVGAMKHVRELLDENGACMIVEPMAGDRLEPA
jgi:hypothetical protein